MREIPVGTKLWKKCHSYDYKECLIVELEVTEPGICADWDTVAGRLSPHAPAANLKNKCRVRAAKVVSIVGIDSNEPYTVAYSSYNDRFMYVVGNEVKPECEFEKGNWACGSGIHGFETREQAEDYEI